MVLKKKTCYASDVSGEDLAIAKRGDRLPEG